jgi:cyclase
VIVRQISVGTYEKQAGAVPQSARIRPTSARRWRAGARQQRSNIAVGVIRRKSDLMGIRFLATWAMHFAGTLIAVASGGTASAQNPSLPFTLKQVGPNVYAAIDGPEHQAGSNAGFVIGDDAVLVVDSFFNLEAAKALIAQIHQLTPKPIRYVVNTHYHLDHTGGDQALRDAGAIIVAHRNVRGWLRDNNVNLFGDRIIPQLRAQIAALPLPDLVTDKDLTVWLGSRKVVVKTVYGHSGGDLAVFVPDAKIVFTGDLLWTRIPPNLIDGSVKEWAATDAELAELPDAAKTTYVPGHGDLAALKDVRDFRAICSDYKGSSARRGGPVLRTMRWSAL